MQKSFKNGKEKNFWESEKRNLFKNKVEEKEFKGIHKIDSIWIWFGMKAFIGWKIEYFFVVVVDVSSHLHVLCFVPFIWCKICSFNVSQQIFFIIIGYFMSHKMFLFAPFY